MKYIFIINPASGTTNYEIVKENIKNNVKEEYEIIETKGPHDATKIASKYKNKKDVVVFSVGGDGTLNEVVNGLAGGKCFLGIIPTGSGNDFYRSLESSNKLKSTIDLGKVNDRYFINITSIGFDAQVAHNANIFKEKNKNKKLAYYLGILKTLIKFRCDNYKLIIDGKDYNNRYTLMAICNGKYYGGGFKIAPLASFDDDYFDLYLANKMNRLTLIKLLVMLIKANHENSKLVSKIKCKSVSIASDKDMIVNIDGEIIKSKKVDIEMIPNSINLYNDKKLVKSILNNTCK